MRTCFRCKKLIGKNEHHMKFVEVHNGKDVKTDFCHKMCWDSFLSSVGSVKEAQGMLRGLKGYLTKMGILPPEEVIIE